jgi:protein transport protein SEC13
MERCSPLPLKMGESLSWIPQMQTKFSQWINHLKRNINRSHNGPVWEMSWAHPRFGTVIATGGFDHFINIWSQELNDFKLAYGKDLGSQVNTICFGPHKHGFIIAAGLDNGTIAIITKQDKSYKLICKEKAHNGSINSLSWAPEYSPMQMDSDSIENEKIRLKLVSGGSDCRAIIWEFVPSSQELIQESELKTENHRGMIRSVCWSQNIAMPYEMIAVGCEVLNVNRQN